MLRHNDVLPLSLNNLAPLAKPFPPSPTLVLAMLDLVQQVISGSTHAEGQCPTAHSQLPVHEDLALSLPEGGLPIAGHLIAPEESGVEGAATKAIELNGLNHNDVRNPVSASCSTASLLTGPKLHVCASSKGGDMQPSTTSVGVCGRTLRVMQGRKLAFHIFEAGMTLGGICLQLHPHAPAVQAHKGETGAVGTT